MSRYRVLLLSAKYKDNRKCTYKGTGMLQQPVNRQVGQTSNLKRF